MLCRPTPQPTCRPPARWCRQSSPQSPLPVSRAGPRLPVDGTIGPVLDVRLSTLIRRPLIVADLRRGCWRPGRPRSQWSCEAGVQFLDRRSGGGGLDPWTFAPSSYGPPGEPLNHQIQWKASSNGSLAHHVPSRGSGVALGGGGHRNLPLAATMSHPVMTEFCDEEPDPDSGLPEIPVARRLGFQLARSADVGLPSGRLAQRGTCLGTRQVDSRQTRVA